MGACWLSFGSIPFTLLSASLVHLPVYKKGASPEGSPFDRLESFESMEPGVLHCDFSNNHEQYPFSTKDNRGID